LKLWNPDQQAVSVVDSRDDKTVDYCLPDITPLLKKPDSDVDATKNYGPVSNLPVLSKTLAGTRRVSADGIIPECCWSSSTSPISIQEGLNSTETALVKVCSESDLIGMMDSGEHALLALLDLSSAFDTVDHDILLTRLSRSFGVYGDVLSWMRSYLSGRIVSSSHRFGGNETNHQAVACCVESRKDLCWVLSCLSCILPILADSS